MRFSYLSKKFNVKSELNGTTGIITYAALLCNYFSLILAL